MGRGFSPAGYFSLERCRESFGSVCLDGVNFFSRVIVYLLDFPSNFFSTEIGKAILIIQSLYFLIILLFILFLLLHMDCVLVNCCN